MKRLKVGHVLLPHCGEITNELPHHSIVDNPSPPAALPQPLLLLKTHVQLPKEEMQDPIQGVPSVVDFDALILEPIPINPSGGFGDVYKGWHPKEGLLAVKQLRGLGKPGSFNYTVRVSSLEPEGR